MDTGLVLKLSLKLMQQEIVTGYQCSRCNCDEAIRIIGAHPGGHYARIQCADCQSFIKWEGKPSALKKPESRKGQSKLVASFSQGFCELCRRKSSDVPLPQVLEAHHVIPVSEGGNSDRLNVWIVCTYCHRTIHHQRTYLNHTQGRSA